MTNRAIDYLRHKALGLHPFMRERCELLATTLEMGVNGGFDTPSEYLSADGDRLTSLMHSAVLGEIDFPDGLSVAGVSEALVVIYTAARLCTFAEAA